MNINEKEKAVLRLTAAECLKLEGELKKLSLALNRLRNKRSNKDSEKEWYIVEECDYGVEEKLIIAEIEKLKRILNSAVRVESKETDSVVNLGDVVELNLIFDEDDQERMLMRLGTVRRNNTDDGIDVISVESPLGEAIYKQEVGKVVPYQVNKNTFHAEILSIVNEDILEPEGKKTK